MISECFDQRSDEWFAARVGIPTASCFARIVTTRGEPSKQRTKYLYQLAGEAILGYREEGYQNAAMQRGIELEDEARALYELITGNTVEQVGLCYPDEARRCACSPDGLIDPDGGLEIKCPSLAVHVEYLLGGKLPADYYQQVQMSLYITGRDWWDFMSYHPGMRPFLLRIHPDQEWIEKLSAELALFSADLAKVIEAIK